MSLVSTRLSLIHLVTVQRDSNAGVLNAAGAPQAPAWADHLTDLPCRAWTSSGREILDQQTGAVVEDMRAIVPLGTDVTELDRLGDITYRGDVIMAGPIGVRAVIARRDHLELMLVRVA